SWMSGGFLRGLGAFPVKRGRVDLSALRKTERILKRGRAIVMFPEGSRSRNAQLSSAFSGAAVIALRNGVPVLPVSIAGTEKIKGVSWLWRRPEVTVNIGRLFRLPPVEGRLTKESLVGPNNIIMEHIAELLPEKYRGNYGNNSQRD
ncbi:lysophospholipid acyltransferase family protein, partial [Chloroflexota bacterium]